MNKHSQFFAGAMIIAAAVLWPTMNFFAENISQLNADHLYKNILIFTAIVYIISILVFFLFFIRNPQEYIKISIIICFLYLIQFLFTDIYAPLSSMLIKKGILGGAAILTSASLVILMGGVFFAARTRIGRITMVVFVLVSSMTTIVRFAASSFAQPHRDVASSGAPKTGTPQATPERKRLNGKNVYYIILDGYPGAASFKDLTGASLAPFFADLARRGFTVMDQAHSVYTSTYLSLAAVVRSDYPVTETSPPYRHRAAFFPFNMWDGLPALFRHFRDGGYNLFLATSQWTGCPPEGNPIICLNPHGQFKQILDYPTRTFLSRTVFNWIALRGRVIDFPLALEEISSNLDHLLTKGPFFLFAHDMRPHDAYYGGGCVLGAQKPISQDNLAAQVKCLNARLLSFIAQIDARDPDAMIILQSDHGFGQKNAASMAFAELSETSYKKHRTNILNAARLPVQCRDWLASDLNQVNTTRALIACSHEALAEPMFLPNKSFISFYEGSPDFGRVYVYDEGD